jgi:hypothetical protein
MVFEVRIYMKIRTSESLRWCTPCGRVRIGGVDISWHLTMGKGPDLDRVGCPLHCPSATSLSVILSAIACWVSISYGTSNTVTTIPLAIVALTVGNCGLSSSVKSCSILVSVVDTFDDVYLTVIGPFTRTESPPYLG